MRKGCDMVLSRDPDKLCKNKAYMEAYYRDKKDFSHWSYLCRKHFKEERGRKEVFGWADA